MIEPSLREHVASDGYRLKYRHWAPVNPRGIVIALHGIQSHSGWYDYSSRRLADAGFAVYFPDRRGSGLNGFQRGHAAHAMRLVNDVRALRELAINETVVGTVNSNAQLPITILGISWGGKLAAVVAALFPREFDRLALLYPGLVARIGPTWSQLLRLNLARTFEVVKHHIPIPLDDPALFTQVPEWQQFISHDPLALHTVSSSFLNAGRDLDRELTTHCVKILQPTLLLLAENDSIIDNGAVRERVNRFGTHQLTTQVYPGARHTLEFEPNRDVVLADLLAWLSTP
ncbi:MAG: alpha/beta fold hydrolase [Planctomycetales bacterium]|jgi:alpha-beta hydrolase superfamily lysophospholipase|nr:alpha/beta fold hydrolase [Planctomycetales bacterium]